MDEYVILAATLKLAYALIAGFGLVYFTRWLDRRAGIKFADIAAGFSGNALASATYYGLRILGMAILVGMVIGCTPAAAGDGATALATGNVWLGWIIGIALLIGALALLWFIWSRPKGSDWGCH